LNAWFPKTVTYDDDIFAEDAQIEELEEQVVLLTANLIQRRFHYDEGGMTGHSPVLVSDTVKQRIERLVKGRFMDLTCRRSGEEMLERLIYGDDHTTSLLWKDVKDIAKATDASMEDVIRGVVVVLQSLCIMGCQVGVKGQRDQLRRMVEHLADSSSGKTTQNDLDAWSGDCVRRLKYKLDRAPAIHLLATLRRRQTPQGAFDLLVQLNVWGKHEDLALLRSGFPIRFTEAEEGAAAFAVQAFEDGSARFDPDTALGLRQDLRHLKVYTIDGVAAAEIDDGISIESLQNDRNQTAYRIWVHIADAERWAPPASDLFEAAKRRITSLYLPHGAISMFPTVVGATLMSLNSNQDVVALSLGLEVNEDGSIDESSLLLTPSYIRVSYRLTYDEVDEMLEEGVGYNEEWELGALLSLATLRREYRIRNGSTEGLVPNPVPSCDVSIFPDESAPDSVGINVSVEVSHNAAQNKTANAEQGGVFPKLAIFEQPLSSAYLLVTEAMILAGEGIGRWKSVADANELACNEGTKLQNRLRLPFRTQRKPGKWFRAGKAIIL
jgi:RNB domain